MREVARLARAMTLKNAAAGLPHGGGKSGIVSPHDIAPDKKERLVRAFARAIRDLTEYIPGPDMGTNEECMAWVKDETGRSVGLPRVVGGIPLDEIGATAYGLAAATDVAASWINLDLESARVAVEGFGAVGRHAARFLAQRGTKLVAASASGGGVANPDGLDLETLSAHKAGGQSVSKFPDGQPITPEQLIAADCDIWIPAARPDVLTGENIGTLKAKLILQGANIPATEDAERWMHENSVVAWIGAEMEFALSKAVASGDTFEHRPSECGHCVQDFLADLDLRDLPGEAARFELGADDALPPADLRFYPAALVVPCGHLPGHAAVAADLGNMAIPNGWIPRRLRSDHCVLWRRYNHIQGLPIPFPQQIPCGRSIIGAVRQKARDRGIELIQEPGQGGAVSNVIVSQIGANNRTAMEVQSEVEFAPAAAYSPGFMFLREPFPFAEDLEAGTVHHQMDRHRPGLPHHLRDAQAVCATRQCGEVRHPYIQPHERADGTHQPLRLSQPKPIRRAQRQACLDSQIRVSPLATP